MVKRLDPDGVYRRANDLQRHRGEYIVPGPNWLWSIDGHCKLSFYGIEIYAAIDAYSQYITWIYVGISGRTAISILVQFLTTLQNENIHPQQIRSDQGTETPLLAAAQHAFMKRHVADIPFRDSYWYGTSTANQRIESWWAQLTKGLLFRWRVSLILTVVTAILIARLLTWVTNYCYRNISRDCIMSIYLNQMIWLTRLLFLQYTSLFSDRRSRALPECGIHTLSESSLIDQMQSMEGLLCFISIHKIHVLRTMDSSLILNY